MLNVTPNTYESLVTSSAAAPSESLHVDDSRAEFSRPMSRNSSTGMLGHYKPVILNLGQLISHILYAKSEYLKLEQFEGKMD